MRITIIFALVCSLYISQPESIQASIGASAPDLAELCERADLIVVGLAARVEPGGLTTLTDNGATYPARLMAVDIKVERALKGLAQGSSISFTYSAPTVPVVSVGGLPIPSGQYGIYFLREDDGKYKVLDPDFPFVVANPGTPETSGPALDRVIAEVAHVLEASTTPDKVKEQVVYLLASLRRPNSTYAVRAAARSQPLNVRFAAMGALLSQGDISVFPEAQQLMLSCDPAIQQSSKESVASAIGFGVRDAQAVSLLATLLSSTDVLIRRGAVSALRNTQSASAEKPLAQALYDHDSEIQYCAVIGLAEITGTVGEWAPAVGTLRRDPQHYLDYWRNWAKSQR